MKRAFDLVAATVAILAGSPVLVAIGLAVVIDDGLPVFFRQERLGRGGKLFRMWKFRTMRAGAESHHELNEDGSLKILPGDTRVTRFGRVLRESSLDELPQLFNVFAGEMSLVGPRPDLPFHEEYYTPEDRRKLEVRPGITGLAQVSGRNERPWKERLGLDVEYVQRRTLALDVWILMMTVKNVVRRSAIYGTPADGGES